MAIYLAQLEKLIHDMNHEIGEVLGDRPVNTCVATTAGKQR